MEIAKDLVRETHEHGYAILDSYHYVLESTNPESLTALHVDENGSRPPSLSLHSLHLSYSLHHGCHWPATTRPLCRPPLHHQRNPNPSHRRCFRFELPPPNQSGKRITNTGAAPSPPSNAIVTLHEEIHELLLSFAEAGANVVRVKGGDPLVFGRGGEEMDFLQQKGIQVKVIPGITAASGISAELRIPLTHCGVANSVRFLTGHPRK